MVNMPGITMNRHIKHWFSHYSSDFPFCEDCKSLPDYMEINDDGPETFPDETRNLKHLENLKLPYTSDGSFMQCSKCNAWYWYRSFTPGGSEDAFRTVNYETISKTGLLGVYMELKEAVAVSAEYYKQYAKDKDKILYNMYLEDYLELEKEANKYFDYIDRNITFLIKDAFVCLETNASAKDNKYYKVDLIPAEEKAMLILIGFLEKIENPMNFIKDMKELLKHPNNKVSALISDYIKKIQNA